MAVLLLREYGQGKQACGRGAHGIAGRGHGGCAVFLRRGLTAPPGWAIEQGGLDKMRRAAPAGLRRKTCYCPAHAQVS